MAECIIQVSSSTRTKRRKYCLLAAGQTVRLIAIYSNITVAQGCHRVYWGKIELQYSVLNVAW